MLQLELEHWASFYQVRDLLGRVRGEYDKGTGLFYLKKGMNLFKIHVYLFRPKKEFSPL